MLISGLSMLFWFVFWLVWIVGGALSVVVMVVLPIVYFYRNKGKTLHGFKFILATTSFVVGIGILIYPESRDYYLTLVSTAVDYVTSLFFLVDSN